MRMPAAAMSAEHAAMGVRRFDSISVPNFALLDQREERVSLVEFRDRVVVLAFVDPICRQDCPLTLELLSRLSTQLSANPASLAYLAINTNAEASIPRRLPEETAAQLPPTAYLLNG